MESATNTKNKAVFESEAQTTVVEPSGRAVLTILIGLMICGTIVRLYGIELRRGFYDEAASWTFARLNWTNFWKVMWDYEGNMVFYYILLKGWLLFGDTEIAVRGLSVVVGVLSIPVLYLLGKRHVDRRVGILSAVFLVFHAFHIEWSQQARSYVVVLLLLLISTYLLVAAIESTKPAKFWVGYVLAGALACIAALRRIRIGIALDLYWTGKTEATRSTPGAFRLGCSCIAHSSCGRFWNFPKQGTVGVGAFTNMELFFTFSA